MTKDRLTGLDSSFLHLEGSDTHMHVASTMIFEGPPPGYLDLTDQIASRLHLVPRFRQKLRMVPFGQGRPVWIDDPHFNIEYHVRHTALPPPGSDEQLKALGARIFSQHLDRSKPLWELWLVQGLEGDRFAIIGKTHHALVDGVSGMDITTVLLDVEPEPENPPSAPAPWLPKPEPTGMQLLGEALVERMTTPAEILRGVRAAVRGPRQVAGGVVNALTAAGALAFTGLSPAPRTPLNVKIGPHRRFTWTRAKLDDLKLVKNRFGGTVNDVVLATVTGALGRFLRARGHSTTGLEMKAMVPISTRADADRGALGNQVSAMMAPLPVWCEDPVERLARVSETMAELKESRQPVGAQVLTQLTDFAPATILHQATRLQSRQRFFNLVITNIPGPQFPLYAVGRRLELVVPMVPLAHNQGLCVGIMSYDGKVAFGLIADLDAVPDIEAFAQDLESCLAEMVEVAGGSGAEPDGSRSRTARARSTA